MANKRGTTYEAPDIAAMIARMGRALARRAAEGDLEAVGALRSAQDSLDASMFDAVHGARSFVDDRNQSTYSWTDIGEQLHTTRQAAEKRYGS
jgi:hypothetical protein